MRFRVVILDQPGNRDWLAWAERMGLDPMRVPIPSLLVCDDTACQVVFVQAGWEGIQAAREVVTVQLEAPAMPFPATGYARYSADAAPTQLDMILGLEGTPRGTESDGWGTPGARGRSDW